MAGDTNREIGPLPLTAGQLICYLLVVMIVALMAGFLVGINAAHSRGEAMPKPKCKYQTLAEIKVAFDAGEIPEGSKIMLDNDSTNLHEPYNEADDLRDTCLYRGGTPDEVLTEALDLLSIPWDHV